MRTAVPWDRFEKNEEYCLEFVKSSRLIFTVLTVELASWQVSEVFPTSYSWKEGSGRTQEEEKDTRRKLRRRKATEDGRKRQMGATGTLPDITQQTSREPKGGRAKVESSIF